MTSGHAPRRALRSRHRHGAAMNPRALMTPIAPVGAIHHARVPASTDRALSLIQHHGCMSLPRLAEYLGCSKPYAHRLAWRLIDSGAVRAERFKCGTGRWRIRFLPVEDA